MLVEGNIYDTKFQADLDKKGVQSEIHFKLEDFPPCESSKEDVISIISGGVLKPECEELTADIAGCVPIF